MREFEKDGWIFQPSFKLLGLLFKFFLIFLYR
jgi:hypothetical protein